MHICGTSSSQRGGPHSSNERLERINAAAPRSGERPCRATQLSPLLRMKALEPYALVEVRTNVLIDIVVVRIDRRGHKPRYAAIGRFAGLGRAI